MTAIDWAGKSCPKCAYVRTPADTNPAWQCPQCHVAYAKFRKPLAAHSREMAAEARSDNSLFVLIAVNIAVLVVALVMQMSLRGLMLVYWTQSVVIGLCHVVRMVRLRRWSSRAASVGGVTLDINVSGRSKREIAVFFLFHYGIFHAGYLVFIVAAAKPGELAGIGAYAVCGAAFAANHLYSLRHNLARDAAGAPHIGALMMLPYVRILPMHVVIATGLYLTGGAAGLLVFGALKTVADALMHTIEHHVLQSASEPD